MGKEDRVLGKNHARPSKIYALMVPSYEWKPLRLKVPFITKIFVTWFLNCLENQIDITTHWWAVCMACRKRELGVQNRVVMSWEIRDRVMGFHWAIIRRLRPNINHHTASCANQVTYRCRGRQLPSTSFTPYDSSGCFVSFQLVAHLFNAWDSGIAQW